MRLSLSKLFVCVTILPLLTFSYAVGQDLNFTQYYASPLYLNPAFAGAIEQYRIAVAYRNQWVQVPRSFETNIASFDYNLANMHSGVGLLVYSDRLPSVNFNRTHASLSYAYSFFTGTDWMVRLGLQLGFTLQQQTLDGLTFGDQLASGGTTAETVEDMSAGIFDLATGATLYNANTWFGVAIYHLHRPSNNPNANALPMRFSLHGGTSFPIGNHELLPSIFYQAQAGVSQLDFGANYLLNPLMIGLWFRGMPVSSGRESVAALIGFTHRGWTVGYSYDYNVNSLRGTPGGSHEITLVYTPEATRKFKQRYKGKAYIQCPTFRTR